MMWHNILCKGLLSALSQVYTRSQLHMSKRYSPLVHVQIVHRTATSSKQICHKPRIIPWRATIDSGTYVLELIAFLLRC